MDFINQVKKLKEVTNSLEVRELCESYLNGNGITEESLISSIKEYTNLEKQEISINESIQMHNDSIKKEEMSVAKKQAQFLMESWSGVNNRGFKGTSGSYTEKTEKCDNEKESKLLENLNSIVDNNASSFIASQNVKNLGVNEALSKLKGSSIYEFPNAKIVCEKYSHLINTRKLPEFEIVDNFISEMEAFSWDTTVKAVIDPIKEKRQHLSREIEVCRVLENLKSSSSYSFYSELSDTLNEWLISESKSNRLLVLDIQKYSFNTVIRNLVNYLNVNENSDNRKMEIPINIQTESTVSRVYSPVMFNEGKSTFNVGNSIFEADENGLRKLKTSEVSKDFISLLESFNRDNVSVNENGIFIRTSKKTVSITEGIENTEVSINGNKVIFENTTDLVKMISLEMNNGFGTNESVILNDLVRLYENFENIVELDFAKNINSKIYEGLCVNLLKWNGEIYLNKINESMREDSIYKVNGTQAVNIIKNLLRYDISEGLTEFLEGESKMKSIMMNDRTEILNNISIVESQLTKIESVLESDTLQNNSTLKSAQKALETELLVLREKWNNINIELDKIENGHSEEFNLSEDEKFNIGDFIKIKESGDTGKIISIDGTSGRYTILLDSGKTADYMIDEMEDLEEAINKASDLEKSNDSTEDQDEGEIKEGHTNIIIDETIQKDLLGAFSEKHGYAKAPKGDQENIDMKMDSAHGYNLTVNEEESDESKKN